MYNHQSPQGELEEAFEGKIVVQGNQYRLTLPEQEVINNGQTVWTYLKDANEVQIINHDPEQEATTPWTILANCRQNYVLDRLDAQQVDEHVCDLVKLVSKDNEHDLLKVTLTIAHATRHIERLEILDSNQTLHIFFITEFAYDLDLNPAFFYFNAKKYPGVEVIDMR
jgi:outer membrane lipoprotein-sorting protein